MKTWDKALQNWWKKKGINTSAGLAQHQLPDYQRGKSINPSMVLPNQVGTYNEIKSTMPKRKPASYVTSLAPNSSTRNWKLNTANGVRQLARKKGNNGKK